MPVGISLTFLPLSTLRHVLIGDSDDEHLELAAQGLRDVEPDASIQSPIWGFYYSSAMWRVAGKIISRREHDTANPPQPDFILQRVAELDEIIEELDDLFVDCPSWLTLNVDCDVGR